MNTRGFQASHKQRFNALFVSVILFCTFALTATLSDNAGAAEDNYLKQLEMEAERSANFNKNKNNNKADKSDKLKSKMKKFEKLLEFERPATHRFYVKLNPGNQVKVFKLFQKQQKLSTASKKIFDLYFEQNK